jgi:HK97 family phage major capsid protein
MSNKNDTEKRNSFEQAVESLNTTIEARFDEVKNENTELRNQIDDLIANGKAPSASKADEMVEKRSEFMENFVDALRTTKINVPEYENFVENLDQEFRALVGGSTTGGWATPADFEKDVIMERDEGNSFRGVADTGRTASDTVVLPKFGGYVASWGDGTDTEIPEQNTNSNHIQASVKNLNVLTTIPLRTLKDTEANITNIMSTQAGDAIAAAEEAAMTKNSNSNAVDDLVGALLSAGGRTVEVSGGALGADNSAIIQNTQKLIYGVKGRDAKKGVFMMNRNTIAAYASVFYPNSGVPIYNAETNRLLGYPVVENSEMEDIDSGASGTKTVPVVFGNFKSYAIRDRQDIALTVLDQPFRTVGAIGYLWESRLAAKLKRKEGFKVLHVEGVTP